MRWWVLLVLSACGEPPAPAPGMEARQRAIRDETQALIRELAQAGRYDCCIVTPCELCATRRGGCRCGEALRTGEPVCEECALMWMNGQGDEPGVDPTSVRSYLEKAREMKGESCACPGHQR